MTRQSIIVTGAQGFIGARIANRLAAAADVIGVDQAWDEAREVPFSRVKADLAAAPLSVDGGDSPTMVHAAALMGSDDNEVLWRANVEATHRMLEWARQVGAGHFVFFSTGGVYPYARGHRHREDDPLAPIGFYGHTKWLGECAARSYHQLYRLPVTVIRLFFPYGPGQKRGVFPFIDGAIRAGTPLSINRGGRPTMNPVHVDDVVDAVERIVESPDGWRVYNLCGDEAITFLEAVERFERSSGGCATKHPVDEDPGDLMGDNSRLRDELGWRPRYGIASITEALSEADE